MKNFFVFSFYPSLNPRGENLWPELNKRKIKFAKVACRATDEKKYIIACYPKLQIECIARIYILYIITEKVFLEVNTYHKGKQHEITEGRGFRKSFFFF